MAVARMHGDIPPLDGSTRHNVHIYYKAIISQPDEKHDIFIGVVASGCASYSRNMSLLIAIENIAYCYGNCQE